MPPGWLTILALQSIAARQRGLHDRRAESQTDQHQLSEGHARRLRAPTQATHLLAWKLDNK
jgi:hypothetical protein